MGSSGEEAGEGAQHCHTAYIKDVYTFPCIGRILLHFHMKGGVRNVLCYFYNYAAY